MAAGDRNSRNFLAQNLRDRVFVRGIERREHGRHGDVANLPGPDLPGCLAHLPEVQGHETPAVVIVAALHDPGPAGDQVREILRPVAKRRQGGRGRRTDAHGGNFGKIATLDDRIGEMRRADHHRADTARVARMFAQRAHRRENAGGDVGGGRHLDCGFDPTLRDQDGIGIGAADVDADPVHDANADRKSMS